MKSDTYLSRVACFISFTPRHPCIQTYVQKKKADMKPSMRIGCIGWEVVAPSGGCGDVPLARTPAGSRGCEWCALSDISRQPPHLIFNIIPSSLCLIDEAKERSRQFIMAKNVRWSQVGR